METFSLVIGNKNYSSWSLRAWLLLKQLKLSFEEILVPLYQEDSPTQIKRYSPSGKVPLLKHGDFIVWDSLAIGEYLNELFPQAQLLPSDIQTRARCRSFCAEMHSGFLTLRTYLSMNCRRTIPIGKINDPLLAQEIARVDQLWSEALQKSGGPFLFKEFTLADAQWAPVALRFHTYQIPLSNWAESYKKTILHMPAVQEWIQAAQQETQVIEKFEKHYS